MPCLGGARREGGRAARGEHEQERRSLRHLVLREQLARAREVQVRRQRRARGRVVQRSGPAAIARRRRALGGRHRLLAVQAQLHQENTTDAIVNYEYNTSSMLMN